MINWRRIPWLLAVAFVWTVVSEPALAVTGSGLIERRSLSDVVDEIATLLLDLYVEPALAERCAARIRARRDSGAYRGAVRPEVFARRITADLRAITHDKHLTVRARVPGSAKKEIENPDLAAFVRDWAGEGRNHGFQAVKILDANVGYLDIRYFSFHQDATNTALAALTFLANTDAVIIDLRKSNGGNPNMVQLLLSHFWPANVPLTGIYWRATGEVEAYRTIAGLSSPRRTRVPLFVLTSRHTISAAEAVAHDLQVLGRAKIIGEKTTGAAHPSRRVVLNSELLMFVPIGKAVHPTTGGNWERRGVTPDVKIRARRALDEARRRAKNAAREYKLADQAAKTAVISQMLEELAVTEKLVRAGSIEAARAKVFSAMDRARALGYVVEGQINRLGYRYMERAGLIDLAVVIFQYNVERFPTSSNAHDSLADSYARKGNDERARVHRQKSVELDTSHEDSKKQGDR